MCKQLYNLSSLGFSLAVRKTWLCFCFFSLGALKYLAASPKIKKRSLQAPLRKVHC